VIETLTDEESPEREILEAAAGGGVVATVVGGDPIFDRVQDATG
jgi:hypothetical protein